MFQENPAIFVREINFNKFKRVNSLLISLNTLYYNVEKDEHTEKVACKSVLKDGLECVCFIKADDLWFYDLLEDGVNIVNSSNIEEIYYNIDTFAEYNSYLELKTSKDSPPMLILKNNNDEHVIDLENLCKKYKSIEFGLSVDVRILNEPILVVNFNIDQLKKVASVFLNEDVEIKFSEKDESGSTVIFKTPTKLSRFKLPKFLSKRQSDDGAIIHTNIHFIRKFLWGLGVLDERFYNKVYKEIDIHSIKCTLYDGWFGLSSSKTRDVEFELYIPVDNQTVE